jgi:Phosphate-induced protein 1 conserved region
MLPLSVISKHRTLRVANANLALFLFAVAHFSSEALGAQEFDHHQAPADGTHAKTQSERAGAPEIIPHRMRATRGAAPAGGTTDMISPPIEYHDGPVIGSPNIYLIWYGNWNQGNGTDTPEGQQIIRDFLYGLSGSGYYATNTGYYGSNGQVSGTFNVLGEFTDSYSYGARLSDANVRAVVAHAIGAASGSVPRDENGIYFVLTSSDVSEKSGFCSKYCGWHTSGLLSRTDIKYAFVGNAARCLKSCAPQNIGPNKNAGVDGMISVITHELEEANTDPDLNAWYDSNGAEDADKCAWSFGSNLLKDSQGAYYNIELPGTDGLYHKYLVQRELGVDNKCYVDFRLKTQ